MLILNVHSLKKLFCRSNLFRKGWSVFDFISAAFMNYLEGASMHMEIPFYPHVMISRVNLAARTLSCVLDVFH